MFQIFFLEKVFPLLIDLLNNNIAILENKIIYFCLRPNFRECTTLRELGTEKIDFLNFTFR